MRSASSRWRARASSSRIAHNGEDDAVRIADQSRYGLAGSVFTADTAHGFELARRIRTGTFSVNTFAAYLGSPFGDYKESGLGREHGVGAVQEYLLEKTISIDPSLDLPEEVVSGVPVGHGPGITA
ncbi:aldehyde dehydrogenase family protein [Nocardia sp. CA-120079]|uniref:aldehyde dehydrogenase family protein n=1 Tax=Nocardia sp. CA-120079 TaxID=3239974 RepID=UPI003D98CE91